MRIDVSDLFDDLFLIATVAFGRFQFPEPSNQGEKLDEWDSFCSNLSDSFFLSLVGNRAFSVTGQKISNDDLKCRIIIQDEKGVDGQQGFNLSYQYPVFHHSPDYPCSFAGLLKYKGKSHIDRSLRRPKHSLILHLGNIPEPEFKTNRPPYDPSNPTAKSYFCEHGYQTFFSGRVTKLYEMHVGWILREITLSDKMTRRKLDSPWWRSPEFLKPIERSLFENFWQLAAEDAA